MNVANLVKAERVKLEPPAQQARSHNLNVPVKSEARQTGNLDGEDRTRENTPQSAEDGSHEDRVKLELEGTTRKDATINTTMLEPQSLSFTSNHDLEELFSQVPAFNPQEDDPKYTRNSSPELIPDFQPYEDEDWSRIPSSPSQPLGDSNFPTADLNTSDAIVEALPDTEQLHKNSARPSRKKDAWSQRESINESTHHDQEKSLLSDTANEHSQNQKPNLTDTRQSSSHHSSQSQSRSATRTGTRPKSPCSRAPRAS